MTHSKPDDPVLDRPSLKNIIQILILDGFIITIKATKLRMTAVKYLSLI
jgi:hypothetical protein